jgi:hypothetical protein
MSPWQGEKREFSDGGFRRGFRQLILHPEFSEFRSAPPRNAALSCFVGSAKMAQTSWWCHAEGFRRVRTRVLNSTKTFTKTIVRKVPNREGVLIPILEMGKYEFLLIFRTHMGLSLILVRLSVSHYSVSRSLTIVVAQ